MSSTNAHVEVRLAEFAETIEHDEGIEVYDEGTVLITLHDGDSGSILALPPAMAVGLAKQLMYAGIAGERQQRRSRREMKNG